MDEDIVVNVFGPHDNLYFAMGIVYNDVSVEDLDYYLGQVFNAMIQFGIVTKAEKMISLIHLIPTLNSHFTFIERFEHRTNRPTKEEVLRLSTSVIDNVPVYQSPIIFLVNCDKTKPIMNYGRITDVKIDHQRLSASIKTIFDEFPNCNIGYIMTKKTNPE